MAAHVLRGSAPSPLERLADDYLASCQARGLSPRTIQNSYGYPLHAVFIPWCNDQGILDVSELDGRSLDRFSAALLSRERYGRPISKHTVHSYIRPVRQMLTWAARVGEDVKAKPQLPRTQKTLRDVLSREEIDRMEAAVPTERDKLIIRLFGDCGLRLTELTELTTNDLVRSSGRQAFLRVHGKGDRMRDVPVPPLTLRRLERLANARPDDGGSARIFRSLRRGSSGEFEPLTSSGVHQVVKDAAARAGIARDVHAHLLRHSWMTELARQGMSPFQLSIIAGTSLQVIMDHYIHLTKHDAFDAMIKALAPLRA